MLLMSGAWFEVIIVALFTGLVLASSYQPSWWFVIKNLCKEISSNRTTDGRGRTVKNIPGPYSLPFYGTRWIFSWLGYYDMNKIHDAYKDLNRRYGPMCKEEGLWNYPIISIFSREDIEKIIKRNTKYPLRPPQEIISHYRSTRQDRYSNLGLVNEQGETWHKLRSALTPELTGAKTVLGFFPILNEVTNKFMDLIRSRRIECKIDGFEEIAYRMGLESTCTLILGRKLGFLEPGPCTLTSRLAEAVRAHFIALRDANYGLPLWKLLPTTAYKQLIQSEEAIYNIVSELVDETSEEQSKCAQDEDIEAVYKSIMREENLDMRDKKAAIIDFIAAGIHTLGNTLVFLFHMIASNPEVQKKLHEEVEFLATPGCDLVVDDLRNAKYLKACINESFRLLPTAPCLARILDEPAELGGYHLESGTVVVLQTWIAGLSDSNFKDASKCIPERWIDPPTPHSPLLVTPFGAGRRVCPGKRFVEQALHLILAKIVRDFEIVTEEELGLQFEFILAPKGPVSLHFRDRVVLN
ncbi:ecdysone 20-monooxygenase isoform X2 [Belonocnema kinseyi]|uniref:ecdysone 20-monooxygenase isoform X2 n=1 Tax=Belonocnema kinseyi TaxID=2817044 RepID=UPI00143D8FE5|nr:ecdysone 20-monooxygenase isoform X2 [Belonocnema kinseyi]